VGEIPGTLYIFPFMCVQEVVQTLAAETLVYLGLGQI